MAPRLHIHRNTTSTLGHHRHKKHHLHIEVPVLQPEPPSHKIIFTCSIIPDSLSHTNKPKPRFTKNPRQKVPAGITLICTANVTDHEDYSSFSFKRSAFSAICNRSITSCISPSINTGRLYIVQLIRWSVTLL